MFRIARVYSGAAGRAGEARVLVDRVWPRGVRRDSLRLDLWAKDVGPSTELRKWFGHDPKRWTGFRTRYRHELADNPAAWSPLLEMARAGDLLLLFGARDEEHNQAVVLREFLLERLA